MNLLVTGGSGFIGREVCERAIDRGHDVTSVSRTGSPDHREPWHDDVEWVAADVFDPAAWRSRLDGCGAVVHSVGIIDESPPESTFERINGDAGILVGLEAERAGVERFVHFSAGVQPPFVREAYLDAKHRAERALAGLDFALVVLRPGPVYGPDQPHFPPPVDRLFSLLDAAGPLAARLGNSRPLPVETVARGALAGVEGSLTGTVEVPELATYR
ncbi:MAG: NAD(P)H-binding protein [Halalkalicoccus sp.]